MIRKATHADAVSLAPRLRAHDLIEAQLAHGMSPAAALRLSVDVSDQAYSVVLDGQVEGLFGVASSVVWAVGTEKGFSNPRLLARIAKEYLPKLRAGCDVIYNAFHASFPESGRWLKHLGFTIMDDPVTSGPLNQPFIVFFMEADNV